MIYSITKKIIIAFILFGSLASHAQISVPPLESHIIDLTTTLSQPEKKALEHKLQQFEVQKGPQIAVLLIDHLDEMETLEQFALRVATQWRLGQKSLDNGVLFLIVKHDRLLRIEVGRGLENTLNSELCRNIIDQSITPHFKKNDFYRGIENGLNGIIHAINSAPEIEFTNQDYLIFGFLICVLSFTGIAGTYISLRWLKHKLQERLGLSRVTALILIVIITFFSYYFFDILALMIFCLLGASIYLSGGIGFSGRFFPGQGDGGGFGGGGNFGGGGCSGRW